MKHNLQSYTPSLKWQLSEEVEEEVEEDEAAEEEVEEAHPELNSREAHQERRLELQDTKVLSIQTCHLEPGQGARCTISGERSFLLFRAIHMPLEECVQSKAKQMRNRQTQEKCDKI